VCRCRLFRVCQLGAKSQPVAVSVFVALLVNIHHREAAHSGGGQQAQHSC
jgi:hypothetical protein